MNLGRDNGQIPLTFGKQAFGFFEESSAACIIIGKGGDPDNGRNFILKSCGSPSLDQEVLGSLLSCRSTRGLKLQLEARNLLWFV